MRLRARLGMVLAGMLAVVALKQFLLQGKARRPVDSSSSHTSAPEAQRDKRIPRESLTLGIVLLDGPGMEEATEGSVHELIGGPHRVVYVHGRQRNATWCSLPMVTCLSWERTSLLDSPSFLTAAHKGVEKLKEDSSVTHALLLTTFTNMTGLGRLLDLLTPQFEAGAGVVGCGVRRRDGVTYHYGYEFTWDSPGDLYLRHRWNGLSSKDKRQQVPAAVDAVPFYCMAFPLRHYHENTFLEHHRVVEPLRTLREVVSGVLQ
eukprot:Sspe_Gene.115962::Locus_104167_Transcript_1_1_Confidence_1.000_Length_2384::g.115962::m.115962